MTYRELSAYMEETIQYARGFDPDDDRMIEGANDPTDRERAFCAALAVMHEHGVTTQDVFTA